jgi:2-iminobutanoate/2-iminopropanoate deaminase
MLQRLAVAGMTALMMASALGFAQSQSPNGVRTLNPPGAIKAEGTWSLGAHAGRRSRDQCIGARPPGAHSSGIAQYQVDALSEGASLQDCVRITVYVSDLHRFAPMVDKAQAELWGKPPYPPRTMIEVQRLFDGDIVEIDSVFYAPLKK